MRKYIVLGLILLASQLSNSQALGYSDLAQLFSRDDFTGSARFEAMGGAFGALGGEINSIVINPAGLSVFNRNVISVSFQSRSNETSALYYGNQRLTSEEFFNISQAGAVLIFDHLESDDWSNIALGINYRMRADLGGSLFAEGNSGIATFTVYEPLSTIDPSLQYNVAERQSFRNSTSGEITEVNLGFSAVHRQKLHLGFSINLLGINFTQQALYTETNNDGNGNVLDASILQENFTTGNGFSFTAGMIYKPTQALRFGISYQSPTWYSEIIEDFFQDEEVTVSNDPGVSFNSFLDQSFYRLRAPARVTLSSAVVFGKLGLISFDYSSRNFQNLNLSDGIFVEENQFFNDNLRRTNNFNLGTEWRLSRLSLRAGYRYEESPDANAFDSDNLQSYSVGLGYNFGSFKIDLSYSENNRTGIYNFHPPSPQPNLLPQPEPARLDIDNRIVAATVVINL